MDQAALRFAWRQCRFTAVAAPKGRRPGAKVEAAADLFLIVPMTGETATFQQRLNSFRKELFAGFRSPGGNWQKEDQEQ